MDKIKNEYLILFNQIFGTKLKLEDKLPILYQIFENFADQMYVFTEEQEKQKDDSLEKLQELKLNLSDEQIERLNNYMEIEENLNTLKQEQSFFFGYFLAKAIDVDNNIMNQN